MSPERIVALLLATAVVLAWARLWRAYRAEAGRARGWRLASLLALQPLLAGTLYLALFPPARVVGADTLTVLTERDTAADVADARGIVLALPEAGDVAGAVRVPDLATALRAHPGAARVQVSGAGLAARDRDAAASVSIDFAPAAPPAGIVRVWLPARATRGAAFIVAGEVAGVDDGRVELLDPAGRRVDAVALASDGRFALHGIAMEAGPAMFGLRVLDGEGAAAAQAEVPLWIEAPVSPRVLLLAGAPGPETRALRRWLDDAGAQVQARIALGGGLQLGSVALDDASLAQADVLVVDARAWSGLGESGRARVLAAVRGGLGLLLRADAALPVAAMRALAGPEFGIAGGAGTASWPLPAARIDDEQALRARLGNGTRDAPFDLEQAQAPIPPLTRRNWQVRGARAIVLSGAGEAPAGWWRAEGRGRVGLWTLLDSYVLPLHGRADLFDGLWGPALGTLVRARGDALPTVPAGARVGERLVVCDWPQEAVVEAPDGTVLQPLVDPASGTRRCAGIWPRASGWHRLRLGDAARGFHVASADADEALRLAALREATLALAQATPPAAAGLAAPRRPGPAWPWFLAWLGLATLAWWLERARLGRRSAGPTA